MAGDLAKSESVFKVQTDRASGTGWLTQDGWLVTSYHVISGANKLDAIDQSGSRHKLGSDLIIDDLADVALIRFVDGTPRTGGLELSDKVPGSAEEVSLLGFPLGGDFAIANGKLDSVVSRGKFYELLPQCKTLVDERLKQGTNTPWIADARKFVGQPLLQSVISAYPGNSGGPLLDREGKVVGIHYAAADGYKFAVPASSVRQAMEQLRTGRRFTVNSGYDVSSFARSLKEEPYLSSAAGLAGLTVGAKYYGNAVFRNVLTTLGAAVSIPLLAKDTVEFVSSTNERDGRKFSCAMLSDSILLLGSLAARTPVGVRIGGALLTAGAVGRVMSEFIPNEYRISSVKRTDGTQREPFDERILWQQ